MKTTWISIITVCGGMLLATSEANAQDNVVVVEEDVTVTEVMPCKDHYYSNWRDNWFIQLGAGINSPFVENYEPDGSEKHHITPAYNLGFGHWFSPYLGWRLGFQYSNLHWNNNGFQKAKSINGNFDLLWDMCNSLGGVNANRVVSVVPFVGVGGTYNWDFKGDGRNVYGKGGDVKRSSWTLPVSVGLQFRFRLCRYADFFVEGRAQFFGDNFNNYSYGMPIEANITALGGFIFNIGGKNFQTYNPCKDAAYIAGLNDQINDLRSDLAACEATAAALAARPTTTVITQDCPEVNNAPLMSTVRFTINSDKITDEEMVNVYNTAEWMKANPNANVVIQGYADKDTGSSVYNMDLSKRRAQAVYDTLTNTYGISPSRLSMISNGSDVQPYKTNDWNRIVIFSPAE